MTDAAARALASSDPMPASPLFSSFETWPDGIFYAPIVAYWFWLAIRFGSFTLPTVTDPKILYGGFIGESKIDAFELLGEYAKSKIAPYTFFSVLQDGNDLSRAKERMAFISLPYPIVAKPDYGKNGTGVKIVRNEKELDAYLKDFPKNSRVILQKYIEDEGEAGVFYIRHTNQKDGYIPSLTLKYLPRVLGDGASTLRQLIMADPRANRIADLYVRRHPKRIDTVIPKGESVRLLSVGNHCKGAIFKNGNADITPELTAATDKICKDIPEYYFGRFDVRYTDLAALKRGEFVIIEYNGAGSEMTHIWDANEKLWDAYRTLFGQFRTAFEIGAENRRRGYKPISIAEFTRAWWNERNLLLQSTHEE